MPTAAHLPARGFTPAEFRARSERVQAGMREQGVDAILLTTEADFRYFSGFLSPFWQSPTRPWYLCLRVAGDPIAVVPSIGLSALKGTWLQDIRAWSSPNPADEGLSILTEVLSESVAPGGRIGVPMGAETQLRMPLGDYATLQARLRRRQFVDATALVRAVRQIKSTAEIDKIRWVCQTISSVFEAMPAWLRPKMSLAEVFREFKLRALRAGVDEVSYLVGGSETGGYDDIISPPSDQQLARQDVLMLDTGCTFDGYYCDFDRNYALGQPTEPVIAAQHRLWDATEEVFAFLAPGIRCNEVFRLFSDRLTAGQPASAQAGEVGRYGHGLGSQLTETPSIAAFEETVLQENMVITLEPSMMVFPGKMLVHEENVLITASGAEWLTRRAPRELPVIAGF